MKAIKRLAVLAVVVCMLWGMTAVVMAASSEQTGETSTFTFTNEGATDDSDGGGDSGSGNGGSDGSGNSNSDTGSSGTSGTSGSGGTGTSGSGGSGTSGSGSNGTGSAKTADVNTGAYVACAVVAGAGVVAILGVSLGRKRRYGKEEK